VVGLAGVPSRGSDSRGPGPGAAVGVGVDDHPADVLAVAHVLVALVDVLQGVARGDQVVEVELALLVEREELGDRRARAQPAEDGALEILLQQRELEEAELHVDVGGVAHARDDGAAALPGHAERCRDVLTLDVADRDDRLLRHPAPGQLVDRAGGLLDAREGVRGPEVHRPLALLGHRVDDDDPLRAGRGRTLNGVHAHTARPHDDDVLTGTDVGHLGRRAPAGRDAAAHEGGHVERDVRLDLHHGCLVHGDVGREGAQQAHRDDVLAAGRDPVAAVGDRGAGEQVGAQVAQVLLATRARRALPAGGDEGGDHVVALLQPGDARADLGDDAGALVAADDRVEGDRGAARDQVFVAVTEARGGQLNGDLALPGVTELDLLDRPLLADTPQDRALGLQPMSSSLRPCPWAPAGHLAVDVVRATDCGV
jgi:hypothetical protein